MGGSIRNSWSRLDMLCRLSAFSGRAVVMPLALGFLADGCFCKYQESTDLQENHLYRKSQSQKIFEFQKYETYEQFILSDSVAS